MFSFFFFFFAVQQFKFETHLPELLILKPPRPWWQWPRSWRRTAPRGSPWWSSSPQANLVTWGWTWMNCDGQMLQGCPCYRELELFQGAVAGLRRLSRSHPTNHTGSPNPTGTENLAGAGSIVSIWMTHSLNQCLMPGRPACSRMFTGNLNPFIGGYAQKDLKWT